MKVIAIVQARMGSTRLPGKVMKEIDGVSILSHVIQRLKQAHLIDDIIIATTEDPKDDILEKEIKQNDVKLIRGSEGDVLSRYYKAATEYDADIIVRITSDCPLLDPFVIDDMIKFYLNNDYNLVTNAGADLKQRTFPRGLDTEVFSLDVLKDAYLNGNKTYHREHVTPYIYEQRNYTVYYFKNKEDISKYRWTLDTVEDLQLITEIYNRLYRGSHNFYMNDVVQLFQKEPHLYNINADVEQKEIN